MDRRALIIGSWLAKGRPKPSSQKVLSIINRWQKIFDEDSYGFRSLENKEAKPTPLLNPEKGEIFNQLVNARLINNNTELLVYFVGHSTSYGTDDIKLILGIDDDEEEILWAFTSLLSDIREHTRISKLVVILDTCHSGRTERVFHQIRENAFAMFATGSTYAFDANFSDGLLRAFELPIRKSDQRIDRRAGGVTYKRVFEDARRRVISASDYSNGTQNPQCFGEYGDTVIREAPIVVPPGFNEFAYSRSIYARIYRLIQIIGRQNLTFSELKREVRRDRIFMLKEGFDGDHRFVSDERLNEYLDFLRSAKLVVQPQQRFELTVLGLNASHYDSFNEVLLYAIEEEVFPEDVSFNFVDQVVRELLDDMNAPTLAQISQFAAMKGRVLPLSSAIRVAMQLLPSTGRFSKGAAEAIYPSERGGEDAIQARLF